MPRMPRTTRSARRRDLTCLAVGVLMLLLPAVAEPKNCEVGNPAFGVPQSLWGTLKPTDVGQLPDPRDSSNYNGTQRPDDVVYKVPLFTSIDIENGWIFQTYTQGFKIWNATGGNATNPVLTATKDGQANGFLSWLPGQHELRELIWDTDAPEGVDTVVASVSAPLGIQIWDTTTKANPRQVYQDTNRGMYQVWTALINNRYYAFAGDEGAAPGIHVYDMTAALALPSPCVETPDSRPCPGIYKGRIGAATAIGYLDGFKRSSDGKTFLVASSGGGGIEIFDVSNPTSASSVSGKLFGSDLIYGGAIWEQNGRQYLAFHYIVRRGPQGAKIYDVTNCLNGNCGGLEPVWTKNWTIAASRFFTTYSKSGGKHFLYFGNENKCSPGFQREWLFDVTNLAGGGQPVDLTPPGTISVSYTDPNTQLEETRSVDYWSYYYAENPSGFSEVMPRMGKVYGNYFYRAAWTIFDVHEITGGLPPTPLFNWSPAEIYPNDPVTFNDNSTGQVTSRQWTFPGGTTSSANPATFTFSAPGAHPVKLSVTNPSGTNELTTNVPVLNPAPAVASASASPVSAFVCQQISFQATGVTGRPPLTITWDVVDTVTGMPVTTLSGNPATWITPVGLLPGTDRYRAVPKVTNQSGSATLPAQSSPTVTIQALPPLPGANQFTPANDPFPAGTVRFHANVAGASEWNWDFGDGQGFRGWTSDPNDPVKGANPTVSYTTTGTKNVRLKVKNCVEVERESAVLAIEITQINPLRINGFQAACNFNPCSFGVNQTITFIQDVEGNPDGYEYDWNGDGSFEQTSNTPVTTHIYTAQGTYTPKLRVKRGAETVTFSHPFPLVIGNSVTPPPPPPQSITISGPASGQTNQALSFSASASGCTATANGWSWNAAGGTLSGSGSSVTITWSSTGIKNVTASNTGCTVSGTKSVTIGDGNPNPNSLTANFTFSPATPQSGQQVTFDASSSTGGPTTYKWDFGDGQSVTVNTPTVTHVFANANAYNVKLEVGKQGQGTGCSFNFCTATAAKTVTVGGTPPLVASFSTNASCVEEFGVVSCTADKGQTVAFTSTTIGATSHFWSFGDGITASGPQVSHVWSNAGNFPVVLTVGNGTQTASVAKTFVIKNTGTNPTPKARSVVLPWIAQTRGALVQSSDLYVLNPGRTEMKIRLQFRKRGTPEATAPEVARTLAPGATLFVADAMRELFNRENQAGFITLVVDSGDADPIVTSFNTTFQTDGRQFGQTVPGISGNRIGSPAGSGATTQVQHLVGLSDNDERMAYFGISNPNDEPATCRLRFFDNLGRPIGKLDETLTLSRFGQRQYQVKEIRDRLGVSDVDDYRVMIETTEGGGVLPYGSNLRLASDDPSFVVVGSASSSKVYLIGAMSSPGANGSTWQSDVLLANTSNQVVLTDISYLNVGFGSESTEPITVTLQPGETQRLANVVDEEWGVDDGTGIMTFASDSPNGVFPVVQGESYDNTNPAKRFGQTMMAYTDADAATAGQSYYLVGLRQDANYRTTIWIFNPGDTQAEYEVIYRDLNGEEIDRFPSVRLGAGKARQFRPSQHLLPAAGIQKGFTVQILVTGGKVLSGAQVVNNRTNDPAYIQGEAR